MQDNENNGCDLSKWRLLIRHLERHPRLEWTVIIGGFIVLVMLSYYVGNALEVAAPIIIKHYLK